MRKTSHSRRDFIANALAAPVVIAGLRTVNAAGEVITFKSPNGQVQFILFAAGLQLRYRISRANQIVLHLSPLGILVDAVDLCRDRPIPKIDRYRIFEKYPARGGNSTPTDNHNASKISTR